MSDDVNSDDKPIKDHPQRTKRKYVRKPKVGTPSKDEWSAVSRIVYNNALELLNERDEEGRLRCTASLLTACQKLVIESETLVKPESTKQGLNDLDKQLRDKRQKRTLKIHPSRDSKIEANDLGYTDLEQQGRGVLRIREERD